MKVFVLHHEYERDGADEVKLLGIYASSAEAEVALGRLRALPGFRDHPDGFSIGAYELGQDQWTSGFVTTPSERLAAPTRAA